MPAPRGRSSGWMLGALAAAIAVVVLIAMLIASLSEAAPVGRGPLVAAAPTPSERRYPVAPLVAPLAPRDGEGVVPPPATEPVTTLSTSTGVRLARLTGTLLRGELPAAGAEIRLYRSGRDAIDGIGTAWDPVFTDAGGRFATDLLPGGEYTVEAVLGYEVSAPIEPITPAPGSRHDVTLRLVSRPGVDGVVVDAEDKPVSGARVTVFFDEPAPASAGAVDDAPAWQHDEVDADESGRFEIILSQPEPATLIASLPDVAFSDPVVIELSAGQPHVAVRLRLTQAAFISGRVRTPQGEPVSDLGVSATPLYVPAPSLPGHPGVDYCFGRPDERTDEAGNFRLGPLHAAIDFELEFYRQDFDATALRMPHVAAGTGNLDVTFEPREP